MPDVNLPLPFDAYAGEEPFVFVSYAHKDGYLVYPEIKALHDSGVRIWFDGGIDPGNEWPEDIARKLRDGFFHSGTSDTCSFSRYAFSPAHRYRHSGFRLARTK
jgi:hypothetical protein